MFIEFSYNDAIFSKFWHHHYILRGRFGVVHRWNYDCTSGGYIKSEIMAWSSTISRMVKCRWGTLPMAANFSISSLCITKHKSLFICFFVCFLGNLFSISDLDRLNRPSVNNRVVSWGGFNPCCLFAQYSLEGPWPSKVGKPLAYNQFTREADQVFEEEFL